MILLGQIFEITKGRKPSAIHAEYAPGMVRLLQIEDLRHGENRKFAPREESMVHVGPEDIVIAWDGANAGTSNFGLTGAIGSTLARLRPRSREMDTAFLGHFLKANQVLLRQRAKGATVPHLDPDMVRSLQLTLPEPSEQRRIAAILDHADTLRAKRRVALVQLDEMAPAIFMEMFGDPIVNLKHWPVRKISEISQVITGNTPSRTIPEYYGDCIEWIKSDNLNTPHYYATRANEGLSSIGKAVARIAPAGSILVTCIAGSPECIGNAAMLDRETAFNQQINALIPNGCNPHFIYAQMCIGKTLVQEASTGAMKGMVNKSRFEQIRVVVPPIERQDEFGDRALAVEELRCKMLAENAAATSLFASLQHRAFRGEL